MAAVEGKKSQEGWGRWIWICVALGVGLRVAQWWAGQPIWHDEWMLLWNVEHRTVRELMGALAMNQGAPPGFLAVVRGLYRVFGESRVALRGPALLAGCGMLVVFAIVARRVVGGVGAVIAVAAVALSDRMIWHSTEIKPYAVDTLVAVGLVWAAVCLRGGKRWLAVAGIAAAGMWVSYTTAFVFAGVMGALLPGVWREGKRGWAKWAGCAVVAGASFVAVYWLVARHQRTAGLAAAWAEDYVPWRGAWWRMAFWLGRRTLELCGYAAENVGPVVMGLAVVGASAWGRDEGGEDSRGDNTQHSTLNNERPTKGEGSAVSGDVRRMALAAVGGPILVVLAAAGVGAYPYGGSRATLFLMPGVFLLMGAGVEALRRGRVGAGARARRWWWVPGGVVLGAMAVPAAYHLAVPRVRTPEVEELVAYVERHRQEGDGICVASHDGWPAEFVSYWGTKGRAVWPLGTEGAMPGSWGRFWVVGTFKQPGEFEGWVRELDPARRGAEERERFELKRGAAVLFERPRREKSD